MNPLDSNHLAPAKIWADAKRAAYATVAVTAHICQIIGSTLLCAGLIAAHWVLCRVLAVTIRLEQRRKS